MENPTSSELLKKGSMPFLHVGFWSFLILFPLLLGDFDWRRGVFLFNGSSVLFSMFVFYLNYLYLVEKFFFQKKNITFILLNLCLIILLIIGLFFLTDYLKNNPSPNLESLEIGKHKRRKFPIELFVFKTGLSFFLALGAALTVKVINRWNKEEKERKALENEHLKSEITYLKYQLQPHFFFNTLNNIYALIDKHPDKAKEIVHKLGKLMRYILYQTEAKKVSIQAEFDFLKNFVHLMQVRYSHHLNVILEIPKKFNDAFIPPLLFISLVENAFKHGVHAKKDSFVHIQNRISWGTACADGTKLLFPQKPIRSKWFRHWFGKFKETFNVNF